MRGVTLSRRLLEALRVRDEDAVEDDGNTVVVRVDSVERRYRDAIKAGAEGLQPPRYEVGLGVSRRLARLIDRETGRSVTIWSNGS